MELSGGTASECAGVPASAPPSRPGRDGRGRDPRRLRRLLLGRTERNPRGQGGERAVPDRSRASARPRCCSSGSATKAKTRSPASPSRSRSPARRAKTRPSRSGSAIPSPGWPSPTGRSGSSPRAIRSSSAPPNAGGAEGAALKTYTFGPLKPGKTTEVGLEALGDAQGRPTASASRSARPATSGSRPRTGRSPAARSPRRSAPKCPTSPSTTRAKSSKSKNRRTPPSSVFADGRRRPRLLDRHRPRAGRAAVVRRRERRRRRLEASAAKAGPGVALKQIGTFEDPVYVGSAPGYPRTALRRRAAGQGRGPAQGQDAPPSLPRHLEPGRLRRRAGAALDRLPARLQAEPALLRLLHGQAGEHPGRRVQAPHPDPGGGRLAPLGDRDPAPGLRQPQRRPAPVPRQPPLPRHRRRRLGRRPAQQRPEQERPARQAAPDRPQALGAAGRTRSPPTTRSRARPRGEARSTATGCATRSASPSTPSRGGPPRIAIGDVGQNRFEELDYTTVAAAAGANFGWDAFEGFSAYRDENSGTPDPGGTVKPIFAYPHSRDGSCSIIGGYVVGDPRLGSLRGDYVYADLCEGRLRALVPHLHRASGDRILGPTVASPTSFGEDAQGRIYVASLEGPVYRLVPR